ncbi:MAG: gamma-glutamyltransferase [Verrucomicrobiales bacterium]|nr:gamma-glutamyltransferase [Verrucomicrobiales bacterium]
MHALATEAGIQALGAGGNAVDAAVASALMLGVVDGQNSGLGGGCFILVRTPSGRVYAIDGRETAPAAATRDLFIRDGKAVPELSQEGPLAVGTPGQLAALDLVARRWGRLPLRRALLAAGERAETGFAVTPHLARRLAGEREALRRFPEAARIFGTPEGEPLAEGSILRQPDLAATHRQLAEQGIRWFYRGDFARQVGSWMRAHGGILSAEDFRRYRVQTREPVSSQFRDCTLMGFPPPSSGGVHVAQILNLVDRLPTAQGASPEANFLHALAESMRLAFADRAHWLGDPEFASVPRGLISPAYADTLARTVDPTKAGDVASHGQPPGWENDLFGKHTTHLSAADSEGWWVGLTATVNTTLGSKVIVPGTGVVLNNEMDDFSAQPGATNFFGLPGAEANAVAPGKRPLSSMSPTLVLRGNQPILVVGAAGGPTIISQTLLTIARVVGFGEPVTQAVAAPRLHHQWRPNQLYLEQGWPEAIVTDLERRGHRVQRVRELGATQAVAFREGRFEAAADPRAGGVAQVWQEEEPASISTIKVPRHPRSP